MATGDQKTGEIVRLVEQSASELLAAEPTLKAAQPIERATAIGWAFHVKQGTTTSLLAAFRADPSFGGLREGWIQQAGGAGMRVQGHELPALFVNKAIDGHSVKSIVDEARAFARSPTCRTESYTAITGATVEQPVSPAESIELIPWPDVPDTRHKALFDSKALAFFPAMYPTPNSTVRIRSERVQVLFSSHQEAKASNRLLDGRNAMPRLRIDDLVRCATALTVRHVAVTGGWAQFDNEIADAIGPAHYMTTPAFSDNSLVGLSSHPVVLNSRGITRLFNRFEELDPNDKDVIRIALNRLGRALRKGDGVDTAIDLGIALEVLLLHGIGGNDRGELKYRSAIRGAAFLEGTKPERLETFTLLKKAYDLRSQAVHSGVLRRVRESRLILDNATNVCAKIALKLIERGSFPDWDAEVVVGGE